MKIKLTTYNKIKDFLNGEWNSFFHKKNIERGTDFSYFFEAKEDNELIGAAILNVKGGIGLLKDIHITENHKRKHAGKRLLEIIEEKAKEEGCKKILLKTSEIHESAESFYESEDYKKIATLPNLWYEKDWYFFC